MTSISIKPGTWVARNADGQWFVSENEPRQYGHFWRDDEGDTVRLSSSLLNLTTLPTYHEPDWRKTKFQVQA